MKAAVFYEAHKPLRIEELEMPAVNDEDVLIKTFACGVCPYAYDLGP
jgi:D-arabinose 1-dehydrogenase-like Zn-dependent alcohol dehydrogenase